MGKTIILDDSDLKFDYKPIEIAKFRTYWNVYKKHTNNSLEIINQIAEDMNMHPDNIFLLALDQIRKGKIKND